MPPGADIKKRQVISNHKSADRRKSVTLLIMLNDLATEEKLRIGNLNNRKGPSIDGFEFQGRSLRGEDLKNADLSGVNLAGLDLTGVDFTNARLFRTNLKGVRLKNAKLDGAELAGANLAEADMVNISASNASFGMANLENANLFNAKMENATLSLASLIGADLKAASLNGARLREARLKGADFTNAHLKDADMSLCDVSEACFNNADMRSARLRALKGFRSASWIGVDIRDVNFAGAYLMRRYILDQNFLYEFRRRNRFTAIFYNIWWITSDCGRSVARWCFWTFLLSFMFGLAYMFVEVDYGEFRTWLSPFYYSVVTMTSLGYGDIVPASTSAQMIAMTEVITGYVMLGGLLSIFANKMSRRAD
jgi:uncharacterized protein YjbI with pentapeptide repeats